MKILPSTIPFLIIIGLNVTENLHAQHAPPYQDTNVNDALYSPEELAAKPFSEICPQTDMAHMIYNPDFLLTPNFYKERYEETDLMEKVVDNWGNGFDNLYGTRNVRPILHGVAYRGGANNYYHKENKRKNNNPLPNDGIENLCKEGFSSSIYLYRNNFKTAPDGKNCGCLNGAQNTMDYYQYDYFDDKHVYTMLKLVYESALDAKQGPVYLHCWNGWHASGFISAILLRQFCGFNSLDATAYWDLGTDGANNSPRYNSIRTRIRNFVPYSEFMLSDSLGNKICPPMPKFIDNSQLHISIEHLVIVPEAIPLNTIMILENIQFKPNKTSLSNASTNEDLQNLLLALQKNPALRIEISGHTDKSGNASANKTLSTQRAAFVYNYLINSGIEATRLSYKGFGSAKPAYSNKTKSGRAANRRIEIKIVGKGAESMDKLVDEKEAIVPLDTQLITKKIGEYILLKNVIFEPGILILSDSSKIPLNELSELLKSNPSYVIEVVGYTDISGIKEKNILYSSLRAQAVHDYLIQQGIDPKRLSFSGCGPEKPIAPNAYRWGRDKNRRIEIKILNK